MEEHDVGFRTSHPCAYFEQSLSIKNHIAEARCLFNFRCSDSIMHTRYCLKCITNLVTCTLDHVERQQSITGMVYFLVDGVTLYYVLNRPLSLACPASLFSRLVMGG